MQAKLLFLLGIILVHGALAAGFIHLEAKPPRSSPAATCVNSPGELPYFSAPRELFAQNFFRTEVIYEASQP